MGDCIISQNQAEININGYERHPMHSTNSKSRPKRDWHAMSDGLQI